MPSPSPMNQPDSDETIFAAALQWETSAQRAAYLDEACAGNAGLRSRVEGLLRASDDAKTFLERPVGQPGKLPAVPPATIRLSFTDDPSEAPGARIGRYKLLQQIGEGGCGTVFMAEQEEPVRRRVALKVIKLGMDTKSVVARFEAERQALAMMDHPNIAKVLDAGATDSGRPYFVMELVRGIPITRYCDENRLDTRQRLDLFIKVCHAIQHAHQKGIIHRDIKPSNILVTLHDGVPVPKVIDFGIAKATEGRLTNATLFTAFEQFIGTPAYMSPEQAEMSGLDIDTRSDIYALGVLLYELVTGRTPFDAKELVQSGLDAMRKTIREREPLRPSTCLSTMQGDALATTASTHGSDAVRLLRLIRGDLDWIVMKCLEKDRTRRYETASGLAADLSRHLGNEPVLARPPSTLYRFQKLVRRNRTVVAAAGVGLMALVLGLLVSLCLFVQARAALRRAVVAEQTEKRLREQAEQGVAQSRQVARAGLLLMRGQHDESEELLRTVPPHASLVPFYNIFGNVHARRGEWREALTNWELVVKHAPEDHIGYQYLAPLLLQLDDVAGYRNCRAEILRRFGNTSDPRIAERMVHTSLILPPNAEEMAIIAKMAGVAAGGDAGNDGWGFNLFAVGLAQYRLGHYADAVDLMQKAIPLDTGWHCRTEAYLVLALAQFRLNQPEASRASFAQAVDAVNNKLPKAGHLDEYFWKDWIIIQVLLREATTLIPSAAAPTQP